MAAIVESNPNVSQFSKDDWEHVMVPDSSESNTPIETRETIDYSREDSNIIREMDEDKEAPQADKSDISPAPVPFKKGQRVIYRYANGTEEEMKVIGVHHDDFPNIYYTIQQLKAGPDGETKEKQTDHTRLREAPPSDNFDSSTTTPAQSPDHSRSSSPSAGGKPKHETHAPHEPKQFHVYAQPHPEIPENPKPVPNVHIHTAHKTQRPAQSAQSRPQAQSRQHQPEQDMDMIPFSIQVQVSGGRPAVIPGVYPSSTVGDLRHYLSQRIGLPASLLQIIYRGYILNDNNMCMQELGISHGSTITVQRVQNRRGWY